jgi:hypothetical protein
MAQNGNFLLNEPTFHDRSASKGLKPEDFIKRITDLERTHNWGDDGAAAHAISFLRDEASVWFNKALPKIDPELHTLALRSFAHFTAAFRNEFYPISRVQQVATTWHNLKQMHGESSLTFSLRVIESTGQYADLMPAEVVDGPTLTAVRAVFTAINNARGDAHQLNNNEVNQLEQRIQQHVAANVKLAYDRIVSQMARAVIAEGLSDPHVQRAAREELDKGATMKELRELLQRKETSSKGAAKVTNHTLQTKIPTLGKVNSVDAQPDAADDGDTADVDAMRTGKGKSKNKKKKGQNNGNGGNNGASAASTSDSNQNPNGRDNKSTGRTNYNKGGGANPQNPRPCGFCQQTGHFLANCPQKFALLRLLPNQGSGNAAPTFHSGAIGDFVLAPQNHLN